MSWLALSYGGLVLLERLLQRSCRPRGFDDEPGLPLQFVKDMWAGDAQREPGLFSVVDLVGARTTK